MPFYLIEHNNANNTVIKDEKDVWVNDILTGMQEICRSLKINVIRKQVIVEILK